MQKTDKKAEWNFYPWDSGSIVAQEGRCCVVKSYLGHLCGYVTLHESEVPPEWVDYFADGLQYLAIHGGITYAEKNGEWITFGFDCGHGGDDERPELQNPQYVLELAKQMEQQLLLYASRIHEWRKADVWRKAEILDEIRATAKLPTEWGLGALLGFLFGLGWRKDQ